MDYQAFTVEELEQRQGENGGPYLEFLRRRGMSVGIYRLPAGGTDQQHPHTADEVYVVLAGKATLKVEDQELSVGPGQIVSVDHGAEHQFVDIQEDLQLLVVFAPPESPED